MNIHTIIGIDGSISNTGIVVIQTKKNGDFKVKESCIIKPKAKKDKRIVEIMNLIENKLLVYNPTLVASEDTFFGKAGKPMMKYTGSLSTLFARGGYKTLFIHNQTMKKFVTDNGHATKEDMIQWASRFKGLYDDINEDDKEHIADAMVAAFMAYCAMMPPSSEYNKYQIGKLIELRKELLDE